MNQHQAISVDIQVIPPPISTEWVRYGRYDTAGEEEFDTSERYAILLVLEGEITLQFKGNENKTIGRQSLVVIDGEQLDTYRRGADTAILAFTPPAKIFRFFKSCSRAFSLPCSSIVPILPELQQWVDDLMSERLRPKEELTDACRRNYCMRLRDILNDYPPLLVGELLVPFRACAMSGEKRCRHGECK